jgi:hypothetical protein
MTGYLGISMKKESQLISMVLYKMLLQLMLGRMTDHQLGTMTGTLPSGGQSEILPRIQDLSFTII